jgi:hypothetical protein
MLTADTITDEQLRELLRDAARYERLRILGCAPFDTDHLHQSVVMRFSNLDAYVDADLQRHQWRGDCGVAAVARRAEILNARGVK